MYVIVRVFILAALWIITCALIALMGPLNATACYLAGAAWAFIGLLYALYVRKVRLEAGPSLVLHSSSIFDSDHLG